jgi:hypothetical protein
VYSLTPNNPDAGGLLEAELSIYNSGAQGSTATGVSALARSSNLNIEILDSVVTFESIPSNRRRDSRETLRIEVASDVPDGSVISLDLIISASGGYQRNEKIYVLVGDRLSKQFYTHTTDRLEFTVSNFGEYGFADGGIVPLGFSGFVFDGEENSSLAEMALLIGVDSQHVSDGARNIAREPDRDFIPAPDGALRRVASVAGASAVTLSAFADTLAEAPLGVLVRQRTFSWNEPGLDNLVALEYTILNQNNYSIGGVYVGLYVDWDVTRYLQNVVSFSALDHFGYTLYENGDSASYRGVGCLSLEGMSGHVAQDVSVFSSIDTPFSNSLKYRALTSGFRFGESFELGDMAQFISTGPYRINARDSVKALFVVMGGNELSELENSMALARLALDSVIHSTPSQNPPLPTSYMLDQNFPNPFNPSTKIDFNVAERSRVTIEVFNLLGQKVKTLLDREVEPGATSRSVIWQGDNDAGANVASGVYLYRMTAGDFLQARKMLLLR